MLAALFNGVVLLIITGAVAGQAVQRLVAPQAAAGATVMAVAALGILVNGLTALLFASGRKRDLNLRGAYLHMAADALVSAGVVAAGGLTLLTGWLWLDPLTSLLVSVVIVAGAWGLLAEAVSMVLHGVPRGIEPAAVRDFLQALPGVAGVHDLHIWSMSTTDTALTCRVITPGGHPGDAFLAEIAQTLHERFRIGHATIQVQLSAGLSCSLGS
jgi:cobalt-zinc-cadmium efflux system protein